MITWMFYVLGGFIGSILYDVITPSHDKQVSTIVVKAIFMGLIVGTVLWYCLK